MVDDGAGNGIEELGRRGWLSLLLTGLVLAAGCWLPASAAAQKASEQRYVVILDESADRPGAVAKRHAERQGARVKRVFDRSINGYAALLSPGEAKAIARGPGVSAVGLEPIGEPASQTLALGARRVFAADGDCTPGDNPAINAKLSVNCLDDVRVDADVAVLDTSINPANQDLNLVASAACFGNDPTAGDDDPSDHTGCEPGSGNIGAECQQQHGEIVSVLLGALDNGIGHVGVAPGARIWSVGVADKTIGSPSPCEPFQPFYMSDVIAGVEWVTAHADDIEVANMSMQFDIPTDPAGQALDTALEDAIDDSIDAGVVYVVAAGNSSEPLTESIPAKYERAITATATFDSDGLPDGAGPTTNTAAPCSATDQDDTNSDVSNYGPAAGTTDPWAPGADIAAPGTCTSMAAAHTSAAAAILASTNNPNNATDVANIRHTLLTKGNTATKANGGWDDEAGTGPKEPLLDVSDEGVFEPSLGPGCSSGLSAAESDVNGDGSADLVTLRPDGRVFVYRGSASHEFTPAAISFDGPFADARLTPAQFIGAGHYVVDVADVTGDQCADLITLHSSGTAYVHPGRPDATFAPGVPSFSGWMHPALLRSGGHEPVAAADVDGDGRADLVTYRDQANDVRVYLGQSTGKFAAGITAEDDVHSALHNGGGEYWLDVSDVTGDGKADILSMTTWDSLWVRKGQGDGTFSAPVSSTPDGITANPAMDDGLGYEPFGVGDVSGDGRSDLVLFKNGTTYTYPGLSNGRFGSPLSTFLGIGPSSTFEASGGNETVGILDVGGDGRADVAINTNSGTMLVAPGQHTGTFGGVLSSLVGNVTSTQHFANQDASGNEFVIAKPAFRRRGCRASGCTLPAQTTVAENFGASARSGSVTLFWRDVDGSIKERSWSNTTSWSSVEGHGSPPGGATTSEPTAAASSSDRVDVFTRGADDALWQRTWTDTSGSWSAWTAHDGVTAPGPGAAVVSPASGSLHLFARAIDSTLHRKTWTLLSGWSSWEAVPSTSGTAMAVSSRNGMVTLYPRDAAGDLRQRWWANSTSWSATLGWHGAPPGGSTSTPTAVSATPNRTDLFVRGADHGLWQRTWTADGGWGDWASLGGVLKSGPSAVSPTAGVIHVFVRAANDSFWRKRWSSGGWTAWEPIP